MPMCGSRLALALQKIFAKKSVQLWNDRTIVRAIVRTRCWFFRTETRFLLMVKIALIGRCRSKVLLRYKNVRTRDLGGAIPTPNVLIDFDPRQNLIYAIVFCTLELLLLASNSDLSIDGSIICAYQAEFRGCMVCICTYRNSSGVPEVSHWNSS